MRGGELKVGYWFFKEHPSLLLPLFHPLPQWESMPEKGRVALAPVRINIIYVINIKITLLCFVSGSEPRQLKGPAPTDGCFLPCFLSTPPSLAIYRDRNLLWWVFRVLFCQGQSGLSNKCSRWSGGALAPATPPSLSVSDTCGQMYFLKVSHQSLSSLTQVRMDKREGGGGDVKKGSRRFNWAEDCVRFLTLTLPTQQGWGNNTNKHPCSQN